MACTTEEWKQPIWLIAHLETESHLITTDKQWVERFVYLLSNRTTQMHPLSPIQTTTFLNGLTCICNAIPLQGWDLASFGDILPFNG